MLSDLRKGLSKVHDVFVRNKLKERQHSAEIENSWEISYGDMITLLLAFFVMFFNIKSETVNMKLIKKDLDKYFAHKTEGREPTSQPGSADDHGPQKANLPIISSQVQNSLKIKSNIYGQNIMVDFPDVEFFKSGRVDLTKDGKKALEEFTKAVSNHLGSFRLVVRGYTDNSPLKHSRFKDNLELSAARSISAIRFMSTHGIATQYMRIAGYGESDGSREVKTTSANQRKISIVLEPLEHAEKADAKSAKKEDTRDKKAIEDVEVAKINVPEQKVLTGADALRGYLASAKAWVGELEVSEKIAAARAPATYFEWIEERPWYQSALEWAIERELHERDIYSDEQIKKIIKDLKKNRNQGHEP